MVRPLRIEYPNAWHHVMNRGLERRPIFRSDADRRIFFQILFEIVETYRIEVHAYSLLDNHYHLLIHTPLGGLSRALRHLNGVYTQAFNRRYLRDGPLFRGRFHSRLVESDDYLSELVRYIHLNPVEAGLCQNPIEHRWTSHRAYLLPKECPSWLTTGEILGRFGSPNDMNHFVCEGVPDSFRGILLKERVILGKSGFKEWVYRNMEKEKSSGIAKKDLKLISLAKPRLVLELVSNAYRIPVKDLRRGRAFFENEGRRVAIYLLRRFSGMPYERVARWVGASSGMSVAKAYERIRKELPRNRPFRCRTETLAKALMSYVKP